MSEDQITEVAGCPDHPPSCIVGFVGVGIAILVTVTSGLMPGVTRRTC